MLKEITGIGVLESPYNPLPEDMLAELRSFVEVIPPALDFGHPGSPSYSSPLSIYLTSPPYLNQMFWVYDSKGFLCSTSNLSILMALLAAESRPKPDPSRPALFNGARELLFPGSAVKAEANLIDMQERARQRAREMHQKRSGQMLGDPSGNLNSGDGLLKTLGLDGES